MKTRSVEKDTDLLTSGPIASITFGRDRDPFLALIPDCHTAFLPSDYFDPTGAESVAEWGGWLSRRKRKPHGHELCYRGVGDPRSPLAVPYHFRTVQDWVDYYGNREVDYDRKAEPPPPLL